MSQSVPIYPGEVFAAPKIFAVGIRQLLPHYEQMLDALTACVSPQSHRLLELGCGTGELSWRLLHHCPDAHLVALDYSPRMIEMARAKLTQAQLNHRVTFVQGDFGAWARGEITEQVGTDFDGCVSSLAIHHLTDGMKQQLFSWIRQNLNPGGCFWNADPILQESAQLEPIYQTLREQWTRDQGTTIEMTTRIGIIGAGIAGLTLGHQCQKKGLAVEIFDKGRAVGGRTSSRRTEWGYLDHGAQYFTFRNPQVQEFIKTHLPPDLLVPWHTNFARLEGDKISQEELATWRYVPRQSMSNLCKHLAADLSVQTQTKISRLQRQDSWILEDTNGHDYGPYDLVVLTAPPAQTAELLSHHSPLAPEIAQIEMWPCWTLILITENQVSFPFGGIKCQHPYFFDPINHLAACGDWCVAPKVEGAFLSALSLAEALL